MKKPLYAAFFISLNYVQIITMKEVWKNVKGYEGYYQVSNLGRVRSLDRSVHHSRTGKRHFIKGRMMKTDKSARYERVRLYVNGKMIHKLVHRLVAETFISNPENKPQVNHIDGDKLNNSINNLEWVSRSENMTHAFNSGLIKSASGINVHCAKLTDEDIPKIIEMRNKGMKYREISAKFGVVNSTIWSIVNGKNWTNV